MSGDLQPLFPANQSKGVIKSPSQQVIITNRKHHNMSSYIQQPSQNEMSSDITTNYKQLSNITQDVSFTIGNSVYPKKTSFTPKGSSGQLFLAFQKQKQLTREQIMMMSNGESRFSPKIGDTIESAHYTKQSNFDE